MLFGNAPSVFNAFPLRFRAFGNALSISIAFPLRFLFFGRPGNVQSVSKASAFRLLSEAGLRGSVSETFPLRLFFSVFLPNVSNAFPTTFPETFPMRFLFCLRKRIENVFCVSLIFAPVARSVFNAFPMRFRPPRGSLETQN